MEYLENRRNTLCIYISNKAQYSLENLATSIFKSFLNNVKKNFLKENWKD